jgi:four helix bundle protein
MNKLQRRLIDFSVLILRQVQDLKNDPFMRDIADQLLRSATSSGANYSEAQSASSYRDFHNKIRISLKELKETQYWLSLLKESQSGIPQLSKSLQESEELIRIMSTICKKTSPQKPSSHP